MSINQVYQAEHEEQLSSDAQVGLNSFSMSTMFGVAIFMPFKEGKIFMQSIWAPIVMTAMSIAGLASACVGVYEAIRNDNAEALDIALIHLFKCLFALLATTLMIVAHVLVMASMAAIVPVIFTFTSFIDVFLSAKAVFENSALEEAARFKLKTLTKNIFGNDRADASLDDETIKACKDEIKQYQKAKREAIVGLVVSSLMLTATIGAFLLASTSLVFPVMFCVAMGIGLTTLAYKKYKGNDAFAWGDESAKAGYKKNGVFSSGSLEAEEVKLDEVGVDSVDSDKVVVTVASI